MVVLNRRASSTDEKQKSKFAQGLAEILGDYKEPKPFQYIDKQIEHLILTITEYYAKMNDNNEEVNSIEYIDVDLTLSKINKLSAELEVLRLFLTREQSDSIQK